MRKSLDIVYEILNLTQQPIKKTVIMYKGNLSASRLYKYLDLLLERGLIEEVKGPRRTLYKITAKGEEFRKNYSRILALLGVATLAEAVSGE